jgi:hypothetical protein
MKLSPLKIAIVLALVSGPLEAETFAERWPQSAGVNSRPFAGAWIETSQHRAAVPPVLVTPSVLVVQDTDKPPASRHRRQAADVCTRHRMHKVVTRGGKSWRCQK